MRNSLGNSMSLWMATEQKPSFPKLESNIDVDVCIVGAGIAGLSTAYFLTKEGKSVAVLDDGPIISGETERTTAHLASALDDRFYILERMHGEQGARLAFESHAAAIHRIQSIVTTEGIECDFERLDGYLFTPPGQSEDILERELEAARRAGFSNIKMLPKAPLTSFDTGPALLFPEQGQFNPLKYLHALAAIIQQRGGQLFAFSRATEMIGGADARVQTEDGHIVRCKSVVVATNTPGNDRVRMHTKQAPYRTYVVGFSINEGAVPKALYWDTLDPYHYIRLYKNTLIVGGEDHKTGQEADPDEHYRRLEAWAQERFPVQRVDYRWSGQVIEPIDCLGFIGRNPGDEENVYIATGDSGQGMTHGTIAGILINDLIAGRDNPWKDLYDPSRKTLRAAGEFIKENVNVAVQYGDYLTAGDVKNDVNIAPGTGAVVRRGAKKVAVYCSESGEVHEFSAVCPHLGCIVNWNGAEKSWDCPCHGSRFTCMGEVLNGPSPCNLEPVDKPEEIAVK